MISRSKAILLILSLFLGVQSLSAQEFLRYGSPYGTYGLGDLIDFRGSTVDAMSLKGIAYFGYTSASNGNPAAWGIAGTSMASSGFQMRTFQSTDAFGSATGSSLRVNSLQVVLPLKKGKLGWSFSLLPLTEQRFSNEALNQGASNDPNLRYDVQVAQTGGLNRMETGLGYRLSNNVYLGYATSLVFGSFKTEERLDFNTSSVNVAQNVLIDNYLGWGNRFGLLARVGSVGNGMSRLQIGVTAELPVNLRVHREEDDYYIEQSNFGEIARRNTKRLPDENAYLPLSLGVGATLHASRFIAFSGEAEYQQWSEFDPLINDPEVSYQDRIRVGSGLEYAPGSRFSRRFFQRMTYRTGFAYDSGFFSILHNEVRSYTGSAGVSFPSPASGSTIDITFMYSKRGQATSTLINENIYSVRVSFNLSELMFLKRLIQ